MNAHPAADLIPPMSKEAYRTLVDDIRERGLLDAITVLDDFILDGRNRWQACTELGITPRTECYSGSTDPLALAAFVVSRNLKRRHLTPSQRTMVGLALLPLYEAAAKERQATSTGGAHPQLVEIIPQAVEGKSRDQVAAAVDVNPHYVTDAKALKEQSPELAEQVAAGQLTIPEAKKELKKQKREKERNDLAESAKDIKPDDRWGVEVADIRTYETERHFDFIITDPPYSKEHLPLYEVLARRAKEWLNPSGLLVVMCGQSYLDQIYELLGHHLTYHWTAAYLTPGQPKPLQQRQVNTCWKPILIYSTGEKYTGKIFSDVYTSDSNDKDFHDLGQSVSGMYSLVKQICLPGQIIFDPFCGGGSTGVASLMHGCLFHGIDIDEQSVAISAARLAKEPHDPTA